MDKFSLAFHASRFALLIFFVVRELSRQRSGRPDVVYFLQKTGAPRQSALPPRAPKKGQERDLGVSRRKAACPKPDFVKILERSRQEPVTFLTDPDESKSGLSPLFVMCVFCAAHGCCAYLVLADPAEEGVKRGALQLT